MAYTVHISDHSWLIYIYIIIYYMLISFFRCWFWWDHLELSLRVCLWKKWCDTWLSPGPRRGQGEQARHAASIETERASVVLDVWRKGEQGANTQTQKSKHLNWEQLWTWTLSSCPRRTKQRPHVQKNTAVRSMFENLNLNICVTLTRKTPQYNYSILASWPATKYGLM